MNKLVSVSKLATRSIISRSHVTRLPITRSQAVRNFSLITESKIIPEFRKNTTGLQEIPYIPKIEEFIKEDTKCKTNFEEICSYINYGKVESPVVFKFFDKYPDIEKEILEYVILNGVINNIKLASYLVAYRPYNFDMVLVNMKIKQQLDELSLVVSKPHTLAILISVMKDVFFNMGNCIGLTKYKNREQYFEYIGSYLYTNYWDLVFNNNDDKLDNLYYRYRSRNFGKVKKFMYYHQITTFIAGCVLLHIAFVASDEAIQYYDYKKKQKQ